MRISCKEIGKWRVRTSPTSFTFGVKEKILKLFISTKIQITLFVLIFFAQVISSIAIKIHATPKCILAKLPWNINEGLKKTSTKKASFFITYLLSK
jgi:hypothetical protein